MNERSSDGVEDGPPEPDALGFGGDSLILGRLGDKDDAIEGIVTNRTVGFLAVQSEANAPAAVYITSETARLIVPGRVLRHTSDANARRDMLSAFELVVFDLVDGIRTLAEVQEQVGLSHNDLCIAAALLHDKAMVEAVPHERASMPAPSPVPMPSPLASAPPVDEVVPFLAGSLGLPGAPPLVVAPALRPRLAPSAERIPASSGIAKSTQNDEAKERAANHYDMCMKDLAAGRVSRAWGYAKLAAEADPQERKYSELLEDWHRRQGAHGAMASTPQELMAEAQDAENQGDVDKAVLLLKRICDIAPKSGAAHNKLAVLLATKLRQFKPAYDAAIKAVELEPGNMSYRSNMMKILAKVDDADRPEPGPASGGLLSRLLRR